MITVEVKQDGGWVRHSDHETLKEALDQAHMVHGRIAEGTLLCTVARDGHRMAKSRYPIWTGAIYEVKARKQDGVVTWRRVGNFGGTRSGYHPSTKFVRELHSEAPYDWEPYTYLRHGMKAQ